MSVKQPRESGVLGGGLAWLMFPISVMLWAMAPAAIAQITPDDTLGAESSRVQRNVEVRGGWGDRIDGGAIRAGNLFHSFSEFNVNELQRVYFSNPAGIENILSRVTGGDVSDILGTLGVDGNANLFLLNPNGIVFGPNSTLDVAGSFVATTADAFEFADGSSFSAVDPNAPPLLTVALTPGLQYGANAGAIQNQGNLSVGEDLTLAAGNLNLQGQLQAGGDLTLHAQDTLTIRDSVTAPFIASSGENLLVQGDQAVDIFALNHPDSGLFAGNDLTLRSATPVIGDAHYWSGGNFRIEQLDESLGALTSPNDPVIRATGDVAFESYEGASLHIFAGGSVTVPGAITITGPDPVNGIVETVTLSDGSTVNINGQTTPTLDIRAGTVAVNPGGVVGDTAGFFPGVPALGAGATSADITIGSIFNPGGTVFLTNQYQPNLALGGGDIGVGAIDTSAMGVININIDITADPLTQLQVRGGDVVIDAREGIVITTADSVNTSANATVDIRSSVNAIGDIEVEATGGAIRFLAQNAIGMGNPNASANANVELFIDFPADWNQLVADRTIGDLTVMTTGGRIAVDSSTSITTGDVNSSAFADVFAGGLFLGIGTGIDFGDTAVTTSGGRISLESDTFTETGVINASTNAKVNLDGAAWDADNINPSGGTIGDIMLTTIGGTIVLESGTFIRTNAIDSSSNADAGVGVEALAFPFATTATATGGTIGNVVLDTIGGAIAMKSGTFITTNAIDSSASANTFANAEGDVDIEAGNAVETGGTIGDVTLTTTGGAITLELESGTFIRTNTIDSSANANANLNANADTDVDANVVLVETGGQIGNVTLTTSGGAIALESITSITIDSLNSTARSFADVNAGEDSLGGVVGGKIFAATGGDIDLASESGEVTLSEGNSIRSNVLSGDGDGGDIQISGASTQLTNNLLTTTVTGQGDAGDITIAVTGDVIISGSRLLTGRESGADGTGAGGRIAITAGSIELTNFAFLNTATFSTGDAGDVFLETTEGDISLNNSSIFSLTAGQGNPGNISIDSAGALRLEGNSLISTAVALGVPNTANSVPGNITINAANGVEITGIGVVDQSTQVGTDPNLPSVEADTRETAQSINDSFALLNNPNVLFPDEVPYVAISASNNLVCPNSCTSPFRTVSNSDFYSVEVTTVGTQITFDIDNTKTDLATGTLDVDLNLYDSNGNLIASNTSAPLSLGAGGSTTINDAFLTYIFNEPGTYFIEARSIHTTTDDDGYTAQGDYTLNVSRVDDFLVSSGITTQTRSGIPSGDITINAPTLNIQNGGQISAETLRNGRAGNITLQPFGNGQNLTLSIEGEGSQISSSTQRSGAGGNLILRAPNSILLQGNGQLLAETSGSGSAGDVRIETAELTLQDGIEVSTTTGGMGTGGSIFINGIDKTLADRVTLINAELSAETDGTATAGDIQIRTGEFVMRNGAEVTTSTNSTGDGGDILVRAADFMRLSNSTILAESNPIDEDGTILTTDPGDAGRIQITTPQLLLQNGAQISASNVSSSSEGIQLLGLTQLTLEEGSQILASTDTGSAGDIEVDAPGGSVLLRGAGTRLAAETATEADSDFRESQAGTVSITTSQMSVLNNAEVSISTRNGRGGDLTLTVDDLTVSESLILAQTDNGVAGSLTVNTPSNPADSVVLSGVLADGTPAGLSVEATGEQGQAGILRIYTRDLTVRDGADLSAETIRGNVDNEGDTIRITGLENLTIENARISASTQRSGFAGGVTIETSESVRLSGSWIDQDGRPVTDEAGNPFVDAEGRPLPAGVFVEGRGEGIARPLRIFTGRLIVEDGAQASVSTENGQGGDLIVRARDSVRVSDGAGLFARATGTGEAGSIDIQTPDLLLRNGATVSATNVSTSSGGVVLTGLDRLRVLDSEISTSTRRGEAGDVLVNHGVGDSPVDSMQVSGNNARIAAEATGEGGRAGSVQLNVRELTVQNGGTITAANRSGTSDEVRIVNLDNLNVLSGGSISASTVSGEAGSVIVSASDRVTVSGEGSRLEVEARRDGRAGDLEIQSGELRVTEGGLVSVSSEAGQAGNLSVNSRIIFLDDGELRAETAFTEPGVEGANISLQGLQLLVMQNGSLISASASNRASGGNISINSSTGQGGFIVAPNFNNSDIIATAVQGRGGEINIFVDQLFGFTLQDSPEGLRNNLTNDISASSAGGPQGIVNLDTLDIDPSRGLGELPLALVSAPPLDAVCGAQRDEGQSSFVVAGREGLPSSPAELGSAQPIPPTWVSRSGEAQPSAAAPVGTSEEPDAVVEIIEAQGWTIAADGTVSLIGADALAEPSAPTPTPHPGCS